MSSTFLCLCSCIFHEYIGRNEAIKKIEGAISFKCHIYAWTFRYLTLNIINRWVRIGKSSSSMVFYEKWMPKNWTEAKKEETKTTTIRYGPKWINRMWGRRQNSNYSPLGATCEMWCRSKRLYTRILKCGNVLTCGWILNIDHALNIRTIYQYCELHKSNASNLIRHRHRLMCDGCSCQCII